ncbi:hypothetical protein HMPREF0682_0781, partial [Propionibacterium acidifaciens F0233]
MPLREGWSAMIPRRATRTGTRGRLRGAAAAASAAALLLG